MNYIITISRIFVGILFILSGFLKLNDPLGFSFKLEEYFSIGVLNLPFLMPYALAMALVVVIFEVLLGVMLLIGFKIKFTLWSLLLMIIFFTFLTFYSAYYNKVTDCGCFGDAVKLTPWQSFYKDIVLLLFVLLLFYKRSYISPLFSKNIRNITFISTAVFCVCFAYYVYHHLPVFDFRPYKVGANIREGMEIPEDAPQPVYEYAWRFDIDGEENVITTLGEYPEVAGTFIDVETTEIQKGYEPPIHDFTIEQQGTDYTEVMLEEEKLIMIIFYDLDKASVKGIKKIQEIAEMAMQYGYTIMGMAPATEEQIASFKAEHRFTFEFYFTDQTTLKTIVRSNPGILRLKKGSILQKLHYNDVKVLHLEGD